MESIPFNINSKKRESGSIDDSDFYYNFTYKASDNADNLLNIDMLSIPRSYYSVNDYNNTFQLDTNVLIGTTSTPYTDINVSKGDYTPNSLISEVTTNINALSLGVSGASLGVSMTYSTLNKKMSYLGMTGVNIITNDKQKYLGFNSAGTWSPTAGSIVSNDVVDLSGTNAVSILTDIDIESYNNSNKNSNMLLSVYPNVDSNGFINYNSSNFRSIKLKNDKLRLQRFQLVDENMDLLDLNGLSWNLTLSLTDKTQ
jgi:hypothetical protein